MENKNTPNEQVVPEHSTKNPAAPTGKLHGLLKNKKVLAIAGAVVALLIVGVAVLMLVPRPSNPHSTTTNTTTTGFTCPDEIIYQTNGAPEVVKGGVKRTVSSQEEITFLDTNCKKDPNNKDISFFDRQGCVQRNVAFTKPIIALADLGQITPLGRMYDSHVTPTDHQYWQPADKNAVTKYNVYTPDDGYIVELEQHTAGKAETTDISASSSEDEYNLYIEHSCGVLSLYHHLRALPDSLKAQAGLTTGERVNHPTKTIRIPVKAGDKIGMVGGNTFDVQVADNKVTLKGLLKPETYKTEPWKIHTTDPISYYAEPLKSQYYAKVSRSAEPVGGKIDYDISGKLAGNWFKKGTNGYNNGGAGRYWDGHLSIAYNQHNPKAVMISTGNFLGGKSAQFYAGANATDPATVDSAKGAVRYSLYDYTYTTNGQLWDAVSPAKNLTVAAGALKGYLLVQVQSDGMLKAEFFDTSGQQKSFTANAALFER